MFNILNKLTLYLLVIINIMKSKMPLIFPKTARILSEMGENIKLARLRRTLTAEQIAERAGITRTTLWNIEKGSPSVNFGAYTQVLFVLGLEKDLLKVASDDELGKKLQDADLIVKKRGPKFKK
jgi:DNA-binding XRE family transcriptional regulator